MERSPRVQSPEPVALVLCESCSLAFGKPVRIAESDAIAHAERHARTRAYAEQYARAIARAKP